MCPWTRSSPMYRCRKLVRRCALLCAGAPRHRCFAGLRSHFRAIGGAIAGMAGADFLCYVTPAEHLRFPRSTSPGRRHRLAYRGPCRGHRPRASGGGRVGRRDFDREDSARLGAHALPVHRSRKGEAVPRFAAAAGRRGPVQHVRRVLRDQAVEEYFINQIHVGWP